MSVNASSRLDARNSADRSADILAAACRVITRSGTRKLSLKDVAREAGVSKALIHYYFRSREDLLAKAYVFADERGRRRVLDEVGGLESAAVRLERLLLRYFTDEPEMHEDWILWSELSSTAVFEPELRATMENSFASWNAWIEVLIEEAIDDGSLPADTDPAGMALALTALVDGLGSLIVRSLIERQQARDILTATLEREFSQRAGVSDGSEPETDGRTAAPTTGYLRLLARLLADAVGELEQLTSSSAEQQAIQTVRELIATAGGGGPKGRDEAPRRPAKSQPKRTATGAR